MGTFLGIVTIIGLIGYVTFQIIGLVRSVRLRKQSKELQKKFLEQSKKIEEKPKSEIKGEKK